MPFTSRNFYANYSGNPVSIPVSGGLVAIVVHSTVAAAATMTSALFNGQATTILGSTNYDRCNIDVCYITIAAGSYTFSPTFSNTPSGGYAVEVFEFAGASALASFSSANYGGVGGGTSTKTVSISSQAGKTAVITGASKDDATNASSGMPSASFTAGYTNNDGGRQVVSGYVASLASNSESFNLVFNDSAPSGGTLDGFVTASFIVVAEIQQDPQLDTPQADVTIQEGQTGTIDLGANFSDANAGDTLTYSISPAMSAGFSFNTSTGVISYNGSQAVAAAKTYTVICSDGQGGSPATDSFSITVVTASFIVDSVSDVTPDAGATFSINYSNAGAAVTASCSAGSLNKVSDNGTTAVFDVPAPPLFGDKTLNYNTAFNITFSDGTNSQAISFNVQLPAGEQFAQIATIDADGIYANDAGAAPGQYAHAKNISGDMVIDLTTGLVTYNPTVNNSFDYAIYDGVWGTYASVSYTAETVKPVITLNGSASLVWVQNVAWVDPGATVTDNVDATRTINAGSTPNINAVGSYVLTYNATDAAGNAATPKTRTVNVVSSDITPNQFNFVDVNNAELNTAYSNTQSIIGVDVGQTLTATNGTLSNDNGVTWASSVQFVSGQTLVRASITTGNTNSQAYTVTVTVNGISDTFNVTTKAAVTLSYTTPGADALISQSTGSVLTTVVPIVEAWTAAPEEGGTVVDSWVNVSVTNGIATFSGSAVSAATDYVLIFRTAGNIPTGYYRTMGQFA